MKISKKQVMLIGVPLAVILLLFVINQNKTKAEYAIQYDVSLETEEAEVSSVLAADASMEKDGVIDATMETNDILKQNEIDEVIINEIDELIRRYYDLDIEIDEEMLAQKSTEENNPSIDAITQKREGVEAYSYIQTYVKPGLYDDSYVVFSTYKMKIYNIDTLVPGMSVLAIIRDENGNLLIKDGANDSELVDYIEQLTKEEDLKSLIDEVNDDLSEAINSDNELKTFIEKIKAASEVSTESNE